MNESVALVDVLRRSRKLTPGQVAGALAVLPRRLDEASDWVADSRALLVRIRLRPVVAKARPVEWHSLPMDQWDAADAFLSDSGAEFTAMAEHPDGLETTVGPRESATMSAPARLAAVLYELLGGRRERLYSKHISPLPQLSSEANEILNDTIRERRAFASCSEFWSRWIDSLADHERRVPAGMVLWSWSENSAKKTAATTLVLVSEEAGEPPIRIVAGRPMTLGRSRTHSDLPLHVWAGGAFSAEATTMLSRIHVTWHPSEGFLDGHGGSPSGNGSAYAGRKLSSTEGTPAVPRGALMLGPQMEVMVTAFPRPGAWAWIVGGDMDDSRVGDLGALTFECPEDGPTLRETLWVAREVGWTCGSDRRFRWNMDPTGCAGWLVQWKGRFAIANHHLAADLLKLDGGPVSPGSVAALGSGQKLQVNGKTWSVEVRD